MKVVCVCILSMPQPLTCQGQVQKFINSLGQWTLIENALCRARSKAKGIKLFYHDILAT